ncbi:MAG: formyltransferase family protein [Gemmatimonadaceae bacterium]
MKVVLVTHDSVFGRFVAATLYSASAIDAVLVETAGPSWGFYARKLRRVGLVDFLFQAWLTRWYRREGARYISEVAMPPHERIANANEYPFAGTELVIGFGSSYITGRTLARLPNGFLNLHTGFLPDYRGVKSEFWALARHDLAHLGWTLHYMTTSLDAGDIVLRGRVPWNGESPGAMRATILRDAAPKIGALLREARSCGTTVLPRMAQTEGRYFTTPRWADWRLFRQPPIPANSAPVSNE